MTSFPSDIIAFPVDIKPTASQRCEPSSRSLLMGEHPHPWPLLHGQDRKSRHRCSKPRRRSAQIKHEFYHMSSRAGRLCYPRSNFSVISSPHQGGHRGSLGHNFLFGSNLVIDPIRLAYTLTFHTGFLTRLSQPLGPADTISAGCHPSQTVHLLLSSLARVSNASFEK
jgi:hypothetical protein